MLFRSRVFERLIGISGIGPKLAVAVLSGIAAHELVASVQRGDVPRLTRIPGVGKKTAERIVLELKDKTPAFTPVSQDVSKLAAELDAPRPTAAADAVSALVNLVDNAVKYSEPDREVVVSVDRDGDWAEISVVDSGKIGRAHV